MEAFYTIRIAFLVIFILQIKNKRLAIKERSLSFKILILDVYPKQKYRICKDNNGGYGTANDYGDGLVAQFLSYAVAQTIDFPPMHAVYALGQLNKAGHQTEHGFLDACYFM